MAALVKETVTDVIDKERHGVREGFARMADEDCNCLTRLGGSNFAGFRRRLVSKLRLLSVVGGDDEEAREQGRPGDDGGGPNASEDVVSAPHEHDHLSVGDLSRRNESCRGEVLLTRLSRCLG